MLIMVSNQTGIEVGLLAGRYPGRIGHLFSPGGQRGPWREVPHALDNGAWPAAKKCWRAGAVSIDGTGWFHKAGHQGNDLRKFLRETADLQVAAGDAEIEGRFAETIAIRNEVA